VTLYLPREVTPTAQSAEPRGAEATVMVVEDDAEVRALASSLLQGLGYRCIVAESGARALSVLDQGEPVDLLFTDISMPGGISGHVLRDEALKRRPGLRVVFSSGHHEHAMQDEGNTDTLFLRKPYDKKSLSQVISTALAKP
jgi:CheY-like chemotaxis protein